MRKIRKHAAGIDIGAKKMFVSVGEGSVEVFDTFTEDLHALKSYLIKNKIKTVAMEATGVYWVILYEILVAANLDVWLVDGRSTKQVPGRKTDVKDCQWIQELHTHGLLNKCHLVESLVEELRTYQRHRENYIRSSSRYVNHMQKALTLMNIRIKEVISQVHGVSGMRMIRAILSGEREPEKLILLCDGRILKTKREKLLKSLNGHYNESSLFILEQAVKDYDYCKNQIAICDAKMEEVLIKIKKTSEDEFPQSEERRKAIRHNKPNIEKMDYYLLNIFGGKDATVLPGITDYSWLQLYSELGSDLTKWKTEKHFTSWLGLAPKQHNSGKRKRNFKPKGTPNAALIFKQAAAGLLNSKYIALGVFGRRIRSRKNGMVAIKAVARKLAELYWKLFVKGLDYVEKGIQAYQQKLIENKHKALNRMAKNLGMEVKPVNTTD